MKKITITFLVIFALVLLVLAACGRSSDAAPTQTQNYTVTMGGTTFNANSLTISKGSTITFTSDQGAVHNLVSGSNGQANPEAGVPDFGSGGQALPSGKSWTTGPWNTTGTFHVTCTYHPTTMTLVVTVTG